MDEFGTQSANINEKWLTNIYENIKKLEDYERLVREGCASLLDYVQIPLAQRKVIAPITQFKNLRFMITEFRLLLADLTPVIDENKVKDFDKTLNAIDDSLGSERLFLTYNYNIRREVTEVKLTPFFNTTISIIHTLKVDLFKEIKNILYIIPHN